MRSLVETSLEKERRVRKVAKIQGAMMIGEIFTYSCLGSSTSIFQPMEQNRHGPNCTRIKCMFIPSTTRDTSLRTQSEIMVGNFTSYKQVLERQSGRKITGLRVRLVEKLNRASHKFICLGYSLRAKRLHHGDSDVVEQSSQQDLFSMDGLDHLAKLLAFVKRDGLSNAFEQDLRYGGARAQKLLAGLHPYGPLSLRKKNGATQPGGGTQQPIPSDPPAPGSNSIDVTDAGVTYTMQVGVGTPPTEYTLLIDTGSSNTWVGAGKKYVQTSSSKKTGENISVTFGSGSFRGC
ncbi:hypothetical protein BD410DRAFT_808244 [Rickenella mellea]|uniref:Peptidase A1 domain-containing protein n=1 Tax=Rickenella mellea TaxID=50990 RepID=A0A4Y7PLD2_9AGAM|nr:hypothetical protein BD410DRAFT_808244 [Rickenella mellea]